MYKIGKLFHLTHVVDDLTAIDRWYDDVFACTRYYRGYAPAAGRDASLLAIGDVVMEPMMPAKVEKLRNQSVKKFHDRFGQHFHSIAWYVDDVPGISTHLAKFGLRQFDILGRLVEPGNEKFAIWTHPRETHGQLEFAIVGDFPIDARLQPAFSNAFWRDQHPLGITRASHIGVVVGDLAKARKLYTETIGGKLLHEEQSDRKQSAFVAVGEDTVVELIQPLATDSPEARDLEANGEGIHSLIFKTTSLAKATDFLKSKGMRPAPDGSHTALLGRDQAFGMVVGFTDRSVPNDQRH